MGTDTFRFLLPAAVEFGMSHNGGQVTGGRRPTLCSSVPLEGPVQAVLAAFGSGKGFPPG